MIKNFLYIMLKYLKNTTLRIMIEIKNDPNNPSQGIGENHISKFIGHYLLIGLTK